MPFHFPEVKNSSLHILGVSGKPPKITPLVACETDTCIQNKRAFTFTAGFFSNQPLIYHNQTHEQNNAVRCRTLRRENVRDGLVGTMPSIEILGSGCVRIAVLDDAVNKL